MRVCRAAVRRAVFMNGLEFQNGVDILPGNSQCEPLGGHVGIGLVRLTALNQQIAINLRITTIISKGKIVWAPASTHQLYPYAPEDRPRCH